MKKIDKQKVSKLLLLIAIAGVLCCRVRLEGGGLASGRCGKVLPVLPYPSIRKTILLSGCVVTSGVKRRQVATLQISFH